MTQPPDYLAAMVRRRPPVPEVVEGSTPVVAFGDWRVAEVATLGINPSGREFLENGTLLMGATRRLATLASLGATSLEALTDEQVEHVVADCVAYFDAGRNPYRRWFDPLDELVGRATGASYYDRTACHLDLVQWATDPVWGRIGLPERRQRLLEDGVPHLVAQLHHGNVRTVLLNGRQVIAQVRAVGLAELSDVGALTLGQRRCGLVSGSGEGVRFLGWSTNLQSSFGVTKDFRASLGAWLHETLSDLERQMTPEAEGQEAAVDFDAEGHIVRGRQLRGKDELRRLLGQWLARSDATTIGDVGTFGRRGCLFIRLPGDRVAVLNSDTKREAVERYVRWSDTHPSQPWSVLPSRLGTLNKVTFGAEDTAGWYCYLRAPLAAEATL